MVEFLPTFDDLSLIKSHLNNNVRIDGRGLTQYRKISAIKGHLKGQNSIGSCQLTLGDTIVVCCVNVMIGVPSVDKPLSGDIVFDVNLGPEVMIRHEQKGKPLGSHELEDMLNSIFSKKNVFDLEQLSIVKGVHAYRLCVNISCITNNGNIKDACLLATILAFADTKLPIPTVEKDKISLYRSQSKPLVLGCIYIPVTLILYEDNTNKDEPIFFVDPSNKEEQTLNNYITCVWNVNSEMLLYMKQSTKYGLTPDQLVKAIDITRIKAKEIFKSL